MSLNDNNQYINGIYGLNTLDVLRKASSGDNVFDADTKKLTEALKKVSSKSVQVSTKLQKMETPPGPSTSS
jgi:hypothetical protein